MPAKVMKVVSATSHPNAHSLRVYEMEAGEQTIQIVANLENVYEVDDLVDIVLPGSVLKDGTHIKDAQLRGVPSHGMALGKASLDDVVGSDITDKHCMLVKYGEQQIAQVVSWTSIELFHNLVKSCMETGIKPKLTYKAKVKLDGCCAGIQVFPDGRVIPQSRNSILSVEKDHFSFAKWVDSNKDSFSSLFKTLTKSFTINRATIFGEWAGSGIQKRTSISQIDRKILCIFAIQLDGDGVSYLEVDPDSISELLPKNNDIFIIPWYKDELVFDFNNKEQIQQQADVVNSWVDEVERCDPFVKDTFGIEGLGEGLVLYPVSLGNLALGRDFISDFIFKAKGDKHKVVNTKKPAQLEPEFVETINDFVNLFTTEPRLEQGVQTACSGEYDTKHIGSFVKWFVSDVQKESKDELSKSGLEWKQVGKAVNQAAVNWYKGKINGKIN